MSEDGYLISEDTARLIARRIGGKDATPPAKPRSSFRSDGRITTFKNVSSETIPPYSVLIPVGVIEIDGTPVVEVDKYDGNYDGEFLFSWNFEVEYEDFGEIQKTRLVRAAYSGGTGEGSYAPESGEWLLVEGSEYVQGLGAVPDADTDQLMGIVQGKASQLALIPLTFAQTGGEDVCPAEWTYTVTHSITDEELGTEIDPTASPHRHTRPQRSLIPATAGLGYYDAEGTFIILRAYEELAGGCECDCVEAEPTPCTDCEDIDCCFELKVTFSGHDLAGENRDHFGGVDGTDEPMVTFWFGDANTLEWSSACGAHGPDGETGWLVEFTVCGSTNETTNNSATWEAFLPLVLIDGVCCVELGVVDAPCVQQVIDPPFIDCMGLGIVVEVIAC